MSCRATRRYAMKINKDDNDDDDDDDDEYESYEVKSSASLFLLHYKLYGRNDKLLVELESYYVGRDVIEIIDEVKFKLLGVELNTKDAKGVDIHEVAERLQVLNAELIAPIHGLTSGALKVFAEYYKDDGQESEDQD